MTNHLLIGIHSTEALESWLQSNDILPTRQRVEVARLLFARPQHLSAEQILHSVNQGEIYISKATVYNTLGLFVKKGLIREVIVDPARVFYDPTIEPHHHLYHADSGELTDIGLDQVSIAKLPRLPHNTVMESVEVIIRVRNGGPH